MQNQDASGTHKPSCPKEQEIKTRAMVFKDIADLLSFVFSQPTPLANPIHRGNVREPAGFLMKEDTVGSLPDFWH